MARRATILPFGGDPGAAPTGTNAPASALLTLLRVDGFDVLANREGQLGAGQRRSRRRANVIRAVSCSVLGVLFLLGAARSSAVGGQSLVPVVIAVVFLLSAALFTVVAARADRVAVRCLVGPAQVVMVQAGRSGVVAKLEICGERCGLPSARNSIKARQDFETALRPDMDFRVYVVGPAPVAQVVAIEPA